MKAIPLFISYDTGILQRALADQTQPRVGAILGTKLELFITFLDADGAAVELESGSTGRLVCRAPDAMDGDTILLDSTWDHTADTTLYTLSTLADSEQLRALIKSKSCYTLAAQVEFTIPSETEPRKSLVFDLIIANSAARGDEGAPDVAGTATWDWFKARLAAGDNIAFTTDDTARTIEISATGSAGGGATWGDITGTLSSQTDLQTALNSKASTSHAASHTNGTDDIQSATASQKGLATAAQITKLDGIEALADVTDATNVGSSIAGSTAVTTLDDTDVLPIVTATPTLKKITYSALKTLLDAMYQAKTTILSTFSSLADASGVLANDGAGTLFYIATSPGGNGAADANKLAYYDSTGALYSSKNLYIFGDTSGNNTAFEAQAGVNAMLTLPATTGTLALTSQLTVGNLSGFGTGVAAALAINTGSAGAPVLFNGAGGTPSSITLTNASGTASSLIAGYATAARGLQCSSVTVGVQSAAAPTSGQVLKATSSTAATWQSLPVELIIACSDESTALTAGTNKVTFRMPYAMTLTGVRANVTTAPTGSTLVVDINEAGTSVLSTKLSIDATELTSTTAATAAVISDSALADDAKITIDIDQIGSTIAGAGLKVILIGTRA